MTGTRGPVSKPTELKLLEGNRGHRPVSLDGLFRPEVGAPDVPRWLSADARKAWKRLLPELLRYNLLSKVDRDSFAMLCQTIGRLDILERSLTAKVNALVAEGKDAANAFIDLTPNGLAVQSALYQVLNKEQGKLHRLFDRFGLAPDARARVTTAIRAQLQLFEGGAPGAAPAPNEPDGFAAFD